MILPCRATSPITITITRTITIVILSVIVIASALVSAGLIAVLLPTLRRYALADWRVRPLAAALKVAPVVKNDRPAKPKL